MLTSPPPPPSSFPSSPPSPPIPPSVSYYKYPLHTAGPATKAVISAVIRNLITVDTSASRLSLQLQNVTKSSFHTAHRFPRPPSETAGTTSDTGNLETVVPFELGSTQSRSVQSGVLVHVNLSKPSFSDYTVRVSLVFVGFGADSMPICFRQIRAIAAG